MKYSFNLDGDGFVFAQGYDINASFKDLCAVCDAIRYRNARSALEMLHSIALGNTAVPFRRHNKRMGSRHELGGKKGAYPMKAAKKIIPILQNTLANAANKGMDGTDMFVVHASANKTRIERRQPSKGSLTWGRGMYGRSSMMHSDIEYAKVELVIAEKENSALTGKMKALIKSRIAGAKVGSANKDRSAKGLNTRKEDK